MNYRPNHVPATGKDVGKSIVRIIPSGSAEVFAPNHRHRAEKLLVCIANCVIKTTGANV